MIASLLIVHAIGDGGTNGDFYRVSGKEEDMVDLLVPSSVTVFTSKTFQNCRTIMESLTFLEKPHLNRIEEGSFENTIKLKILDLSACKYLSQIQDGAFTNSSIMQIQLSEGLRLIGKRAFYNTSLTTLSLPNSVFWIGDEAFLQSALKSIYISNLSKLCTIGMSAFAHTNLYRIFIPKYVTEIGSSCFSYSNIREFHVDLQNQIFFFYQRFIYTHYTVIHSALPTLTGIIKIPEGATEILPTAFEGCRVQSVQFPPSLKRIDSYAFANSSVEIVVVKQNIEYIGQCAFLGCRNLTFLSIESSSTVISENSFVDTNINCGVLCPISQIESLRKSGLSVHSFEKCKNMKEMPCPEFYSQLEFITHFIYDAAQSDPELIFPPSSKESQYDYGNMEERVKKDEMITAESGSELDLLSLEEQKETIKKMANESQILIGKVVERGDNGRIVVGFCGDKNDMEVVVAAELGDSPFTIEELVENVTHVFNVTLMEVNTYDPLNISQGRDIEEIRAAIKSGNINDIGMILNISEVNETDLNISEINETDLDISDVNETDLEISEINENDINISEINETDFDISEINETDTNISEVNETDQNISAESNTSDTNETLIVSNSTVKVLSQEEIDGIFNQTMENNTLDESNTTDLDSITVEYQNDGDLSDPEIDEEEDMEQSEESVLNESDAVFDEI